MFGLFRREPNAAEIVAQAISRHDWRTAALFLTAGALETLHTDPELQAETKQSRRLQLALSKVKNT